VDEVVQQAIIDVRGVSAVLPMHDDWLEFGKVAVAHWLAVASPGPDFAVVLRQSVRHGRRPAIVTSVGVGAAVALHVGYSLLGLGVLIRSSPAWFSFLKYAGAFYLAWLGVQALRAPRRPVEIPATPAMENHSTEREPGLGTSWRAAFFMGFLTNALNPKATFFFLSVFVVIVSVDTPRIVQAGYGAWMVVATMGWFSLVAVVFTQTRVRAQFLRWGHWIDRAMGILFLGFAASLVFASIE